MSAARTPGPWALDDEGRGEIVSLDPMFPVPICDMRIAFWRNLRASAAHGLKAGEVDEAIQLKLNDAAFIVETCNAHDGLVAENARLREALVDCERLISDVREHPESIGCGGWELGWSELQVSAVHNKALAALAGAA